MQEDNILNSSIDKKTIPMIRIGKVTNNVDSKKGGRIQVRIEGIDKDLKDNELQYCVPLLPRFLNILPKQDEIVFVLQYEFRKVNKYSQFSTQRFWIGPLIPQINKLQKSPEVDARSIMTGGQLVLPNPVGKNFEGAYPDDGDIALQGRYNTDLILKENQVWLRAGKLKDTPENNVFNDNDIGYIQLKYGGDKIKQTTKDKTISSYIYDLPTKQINVKISTMTSTGQVLAGNLTPEEYSNQGVSTIVEVKVYNISGKKILSESDIIGQTPPPPANPTFPTRNGAISFADTFIAPFATGKWKVVSSAEEVLKNYGGQDAIKNGFALFKGSKREIKKTYQVNEITKEKEKKESVINVVANKINLLSHGGNNFELTNPTSLINEETQEKINKEAHPLVYGDKLVEFLELVKKYVTSHIHSYHGMPATELPNKLNVLTFDLDSILNKNINSN